MLLSSMTWEEVSELDRDLITVIPFGAIEQHSYHLPLGTDSFIVEGIALELEKRIPHQVCLLPTTFLGCSRHHMAFAGSLTARTATFINIGEELVESMARHGFRRFLLLNGHGGNIEKISIAAENVSYFPGLQLQAIAVTYWHLIQKEIRAVRETPLGGMGHACELETSLMLLLRPELVHRERMRPGGLQRGTRFTSGDMFDSGSVTLTKSFEEISSHGGLGDPTTASSEKGRVILDLIVNKLIELVGEVRSGTL